MVYLACECMEEHGGIICLTWTHAIERGWRGVRVTINKELLATGGSFCLGIPDDLLLSLSLWQYVIISQYYFNNIVIPRVRSCYCHTLPDKKKKKKTNIGFSIEDCI